MTSSPELADARSDTARSDFAGMTDTQIASFHRDGFISITTPIATPEELEKCIQIYDKLFQAKAGFENGHFFDLAGNNDSLDTSSFKMPQLLAPTAYEPSLKDLQLLKTLSTILSQLFNQPIEATMNHCILKHPNTPEISTPLHQDEAYWSPDYYYNSVSVWMPLSEVGPDGGCLHFVPGSHRYDVLPHKSIGGDVKIHGLELDLPEQDLQELSSKAIPCPLPAGGVTIHTNRTIHFAKGNSTDQPRRAIIMGGGIAGSKYYGQRRFPWNEIKEAARQDRLKK